jgi:hypothetical protein
MQAVGALNWYGNVMIIATLPTRHDMISGIPTRPIKIRLL